MTSSPVTPAVVNSDAGLDLEALVLLLRDPPRRCLSVPLVTERTLVGVLTVYSKESSFCDRHANIMTVVADRIAPTLRVAYSERLVETRG